MKFGVKNIRDGEISYETTDSVRADEAKCTVEGKFFESEKRLSFKIFKHNIKNNTFNIILGIIGILYVELSVTYHQLVADGVYN